MSKKRNKFAAAMTAMTVAAMLSACGKDNAKKAEELYRAAQEASLEEDQSNNDIIEEYYRQAMKLKEKTQNQEVKEGVTQNSCDVLTSSYGTGFTYWYDKSRDNANSVINIIKYERTYNQRDKELLDINLASYYRNEAEAKKWYNKIITASKSTERENVQARILKSTEQMQELEEKNKILEEEVAAFLNIPSEEVKNYASQIQIDDIIDDTELSGVGVSTEVQETSLGTKAKILFDGLLNSAKQAIGNFFSRAATKVDIATKKMDIAGCETVGKTGNEDVEKPWAAQRGKALRESLKLQEGTETSAQEEALQETNAQAEQGQRPDR